MTRLSAQLKNIITRPENKGLFHNIEENLLCDKLPKHVTQLFFGKLQIRYIPV